MRRTEKIKVHFRKFQNGEIIALFPDSTADLDGNIISYLHIGQHGAADPDLIKTLPKATPEEYQDLEKELKRMGYKLNILK